MPRCATADKKYNTANTSRLTVFLAAAVLLSRPERHGSAGIKPYNVKPESRKIVDWCSVSAIFVSTLMDLNYLNNRHMTFQVRALSQK
jgi:hypothetical protein